MLRSLLSRVFRLGKNPDGGLGLALERTARLTDMTSWLFWGCSQRKSGKEGPHLHGINEAEENHVLKIPREMLYQVIQAPIVYKSAAPISRQARAILNELCVYHLHGTDSLPSLAAHAAVPLASKAESSIGHLRPRQLKAHGDHRCSSA